MKALTTSSLLSGKTVLLTGCSSVLGQAIATGAARHGAEALLLSDAYEEPRGGEPPTAEQVRELGVPARFQWADVTTQQDNEALVAAAMEFGGVDVLILNAGISLRADGPEVSSEDFRRLMAANVDAALFGAQAAARQMKSLGKAGSIILMASMSGIAANGDTLAYSISKGSVITMARALADAHGPAGIRVNAVAPGPIETKLLQLDPDLAREADRLRQRTPLRRLAKPHEIADAVAFLGSEMGAYVTGTVLAVDGGLLSVL